GLQFKQNIVFAVPAVVYEQIDLAGTLQQGPQPPSARASNISPRCRQISADNRADLVVDVRNGRRRQINAPKLAKALTPKRFEDKPAGYAVSHPRLHHLAGAQMSDQAPN